MRPKIKISRFDYPLPEERIAKFPLERREDSRLLVYKNEAISESVFNNIGTVLPPGSLLVFNNTRVVRARIVMHKPSGARIEIFCLEPLDPADYERAFAARGTSVWQCIVGNSKKWKEGDLSIGFEYRGRPATLSATRLAPEEVRFNWDANITFGQLLEHLGRVPIPPYLGRESQEIDTLRYQTVYSRLEGSVAAPTAGLHFSRELIDRLKEQGIDNEEVTLHVGAGTFLPIKGENAAEHAMHAEHFSVTLAALKELRSHTGGIVAVGTTTVRTLESLTALAWRIRNSGATRTEQTVGQWELYDIPGTFGGKEVLDTLIEYLTGTGETEIKASTRIMITPGYRFRLVDALITNFHQPRSTLLLLVAALVGHRWHEIYDYALSHGFRFLSYGDSSILFREDNGE